MKIGILIKQYENPKNWELSILSKLLEESNIEVVLILKNQIRTNEKKISFSGFFNQVNSFIGDLFLRFLTLNQREVYHFRNKSLLKDSFFSIDKDVEILELSEIEESTTEVFTSSDLKEIESHNLSFILNLNYEFFKGVLWNLNNIPICTLRYSGFFETEGKYAGIKEVISGTPNICISLVRLNNLEAVELTIDQSYCNLDFTFNYRNSFNLIVENAMSLLTKNLKFENNNGRYKNYLETGVQNRPNFLQVLIYLRIYHIKLFNRQLFKIFSLFGMQNGRWTLFLGMGNFLEANISESTEFKLSKGHFWADPFLFKYRNQYYVFFENYPYSLKKGKISCGRIEKNALIDVVDVLDFDYHLSYPFLFEEGGEIFMMPESFENKKLEIYRCLNFPNQWELYSSAFHGEEVVDSTYFMDNLNQKWLFVNKRCSIKSTFDSELHIYKIDSLKLEHITEHKQNPVLIDARVARNGGAIFEYNGNFYRPSQRNTNGAYGEGLNINLIEKLSIEEYKEKTVRIFEPDFRKGFIGLHHLHQIDDMFVFDAAYKSH